MEFGVKIEKMTQWRNKRTSPRKSPLRTQPIGKCIIKGETIIPLEQILSQVTIQINVG